MATGVGLIGCGYWGPNLARAFSRLAPSVLVALCDRDPERLAKVLKDYPEARGYADSRDLLADKKVDAVAIAAPASSHHHLALQAFAAGKHVFVEKPLATTIREAQDMVDAAERAERILMVGHLLKFHPAVDFIRSYLETGKLGDVWCVYSQRLNLGQVRKDENAVWSLAPHDISLAHYLLKELTTHVSVSGGSFLRSGVENLAFLTLRFAGGALGHIHVSWLDPHKVRKLTVVGSKQMIVFDDMKPTDKVQIFDKGVNRPGNLEPSALTSLSLRFGDVFVPQIGAEEPLVRECRHFTECVEQGHRPLAGGQDGLEVVAVLAAAQDSLRSGGALKHVSYS